MFVSDIGTGPPAGAGSHAAVGGVVPPPAGRPAGEDDPPPCHRQLRQRRRPDPEAVCAGRGAMPRRGYSAAVRRHDRGPRPPAGQPARHRRRRRAGAGSAGQRLFCLRRAGGYGVSPQDLRRLCPACRGVSGAPGGHRRGRGTQLVVRGVSASVYRCRLRAGGRGAGGRHDSGRPVPHDRRERRVCAALPLAGAVGAHEAVAGQRNDDGE